MTINIRKYDQYVNIEVDIGDGHFDLGFHTEAEALRFMSTLVVAAEEIEDTISAIKN
jgi:hypothetical protein